MKKTLLYLILAGIIIGLAVGIWLGLDGKQKLLSNRSLKVMAYLRGPGRFQEWQVDALTRCRNAPFLMPTSGMIGYVWDDSFRVGHHHTGLDIFGAEGVGKTAVYAAYDGYLTRQPGWKSSLIIRIPSDPLSPGEQIWTYYTHLADAEGNSYILDAFPMGTSELFVEAGTLLGYQGNYSGNALKPVGTHLHFSVVKSDSSGQYLNETNIENTLDPSPYFGFDLSAELVGDQIPHCTGDMLYLP
jgi:peptidoglycan LD-endopeptidase LytH